MNKPNYLYGITGLLAGLIIGYIGTNYINQTSGQTFGPAVTSNDPAATSNTLPPDHPPTGNSSGNPSGNPSSVPPSGSDGDPQSDVMADIQRAKNEPSNFDAQMRAAGLFKQINRPEGALEFYERALKTRPNDFKLLVTLGDTNFDLKRYEEAERWYQLALKQNPNDATVRMDLGLSFYLRSPRDLDKALAAYRGALKVDPRHEKALQNLTQALIEKGDKAAARDSLRQLDQINPNNQAVAQFRSQLQQ